MGILSAALFGLATPLSKILLASVPQFTLAGLLYLGAGVGMIPFAAAEWRTGHRKRIDRTNALRLAGAVVFGGGCGPVFLLLGLSFARAGSVSLLLNLELVTTAILGVLFFRDHLDPRGWVGIGGALLAGTLVTAGEGTAGIVPSLFVALACACWGLDNNLTALIDALTPRQITVMKGLIAGAVNLCIGVAATGAFPRAGASVASLALGAACYGGSIALFIAAAQRTGAARGQVLFASAPFFGLLFSVVLLSEKLTWPQAAAALVLLGSIALMLRARHAHVHRHESTAHIHAHRHDDLHHGHVHAEGTPALNRFGQHSHEHIHEAVEHEHPHVPDLHHRHSHRHSHRHGARGG
jgi:drug/metabolite transporter (DMT)-like permease